MNWWGRLTSRHTLERQLDAELRDHFERLVADYRREGLTADEARRRARLEFGGLDQVKELCRDVRGTRWIADLAQDVRYGCRGLRKHPSFTAVAVVTLAVGVAATMTIFNLVDALLLRPLPVPKATELVTLVRWQGGNSSEHFSYPQVRLLAERTDLFAALAGIGSDTVNVGPPEALEPTGAAWVAGGHFPTLGLVPAAGRLLSAADDQAGAAPAAVITYSYWMRRFSGDTAAVGTHLLIEGVNVPIVGITPPGFTGATVGERADITLAISARPRLQPENDSFPSASSRWLRILARPPRDVDPEQLQAALDVAWPQVLLATVPDGINAETRARTLTMTVSVQPGARGTSLIRTRFRTPLTVALALVGLVLVIACVNVATLLLARDATRAREMALRVSLGASRIRILRQLLTESALLALLGTVIGIALAVAGSHGLVALIATGATGPDAPAVSVDVALNWRVSAAAVGVMAVTTLLFGLVPACRVSLAAPRVPSASAHRVAESHGRLATTLIIAQIGLSLALLTGAGLVVRSLHNLRALDRGFRTDNVLLVSFDPTRARLSSAELQDFNRSVLGAVEHLPGIQAASLAAVTPLQGGGMSRPMFINGVSTGEQDVYFNIVAPRFFEIMHTPLVLGRDFTLADDASRPAVAVVNETFVRQYLQPGSAVGQRVSLTGTGDEMQIVGVARDAVYETLRAAAPPTVYMSYLQQRGRRMTLVIDAPDSVAAAAAAVRTEVQPRVPTQPLRVRTLAAQVEGSLIRERLMATLTSIFGTVALALAAVGLYGLVSYSVTNRTREIGVRLALGARHTAIERRVLQDALRLVALGIAIGLPAVWLVSRLVRALIVGVTPTDPVTMAGAVSVLATVGVLAALGPARRAARIDPVASLRAE
ncbi:MAG TPA: ABC transporter permease [Longimicrobiales bacterium]|nr:ABC transporter permease [Longimicrobiales bacterium]